MGNRKESLGNEVEVACKCDEKRGALRIGIGAVEIKVQRRRKRGRPKKRWLDKVKDDIKEKRLSVDEVYDRATWRRIVICHRTSTPHKSGNNMKKRLSREHRET